MGRSVALALSAVSWSGNRRGAAEDALTATKRRRPCLTGRGCRLPAVEHDGDDRTGHACCTNGRHHYATDLCYCYRQCTDDWVA